MNTKMSNLLEHEDYTKNRLSELDLYSIVKKNKINDLVKHEKWSAISTCFPLIFNILESGKFNHIEKIPVEMFDSYALCLSLFNYNLTPQQLHLIPITYLNNVEFIIEALTINHLHIQVIPEQYWNKKVIIDWYCNNYALKEPLQFLPSYYGNNVELNKMLIQENCLNYKYLSEFLKNDFSLYEIAINKNAISHIYSMAGPTIRNNEKYTIEALKINPTLYCQIGESLKNNVFFFLNLINHHCNVLEYSNDSIKDNEQCVWESFKQFPDSLAFASERLLNTPSFFLQLIKEVNFSVPTQYFTYWGDNVRDNHSTMKEILPILSLTQNFNFISENLRSTEQFVLDIVLIDPTIIAYIESPLTINSQFFIKAYNFIDQQCLGQYRYDLNGPQSTIFNYISYEAINNEQFIIDLYEEFKTMFFTVIYPKIKHLGGSLVDMLNDLEQETDNMSHFMEKLKLKHNLQKDLIIHEKHKIHKI